MIGCKVIAAIARRPFTVTNTGDSTGRDRMSRRHRATGSSKPRAVIAIARLTTTALLILLACLPSIGDDLPVSACVPISPRLIEVRPQDLSKLSERQRINLQSYLADRAVLEPQVPKRLYLMRGTELDSERDMRLSLIFEGRRCAADRCLGVAVIPRDRGTEIRRFSYKNNFASVPLTNLPIATKAGYGRSRAFVFMDPEERLLLAFYDQFEDTTDSIAIVFVDERTLANEPAYALYRSCLKNAFEASGPIGQLPAR